jgi:type II secretory pathway pseudopilin PulG
LVELLVVIAIIGVLLAILLPAVQQARESARRTYCQSNLRQIGLALQTYHQYFETFPPGCLDWRPWNGPRHLKNYAWSALILPYIEQGNVSDEINFNLPFDDASNFDIGNTDLAIYRCPSSEFRGKKNSGRSDYGGLYGQRITTKNNTNNGIFINDRPIRMIDIRDGLTNTMAVAEDVLGPDPQWINGRNIFEQAWGVNDPASITRDRDRRILFIDNEIHSDHPAGAASVFACGRYQFLSNSIDRVLLAAYITRDGGEVIEGLYE